MINENHRSAGKRIGSFLRPLLFSVLILLCVFAVPKVSRASISGPSGLKSYHAYVAIDARTGTVLMGDKYNSRVYPASTTKIMTAMVVLEKLKADGVSLKKSVTITQSMLDPVERSLAKYGIRAGESYTYETLLHMALITSYGDATYALAIKVFGSTSACVSAMNRKVKALGLTGTHFDNVVGLDTTAGYTSNYTTALDMAKITQYAMKNSTFRSIVKKSTYAVCQSDGTKGKTIETSNYLLSYDKYKTDAYTVIGTKTGTTNAAGYVLSSTAEDSEGHQVICVLMSRYSEDSRFYDSKKILDKVFANRYTLNLRVPQLSTPVLKSVSNVDGGVKITWSAVKNGGTYRVFRRVAGETWQELGDTAETSYVDRKKLVPGTKYIYTVRCVAENGKQYASSYDKTGLSLYYLTAPKMTEIKLNNNGMTVRWNAVTGASSYRVYRWGGGKWNRLSEVKGTAFVDRTMTVGSNRYTVVALRGDSHSIHDRNGISAVFRDTPKLLVNGGNTDNGTYVKWKAVSGAGGYRVYRKTVSGSWTNVGTVTGTSFEDTGVTAGDTYIYTVKCLDPDTGATESYYDPDGVTVVRLTAPKLLSCIGDRGRITLKWEAVSGASGYRIYRKDSTSSWKHVGTVTGTFWQDTDVREGVTYTYTVRGVSGSSISTYDKAGLSGCRIPATQPETVPETERPTIPVTVPETSAERPTETKPVAAVETVIPETAALSGTEEIPAEAEGETDSQQKTEE